MALEQHGTPQKDVSILDCDMSVVKQEIEMMKPNTIVFKVTELDFSERYVYYNAPCQAERHAQEIMEASRNLRPLVKLELVAIISNVSQGSSFDETVELITGRRL